MLKDGIETDPKKIEAIVKWPTPKTMTDVRNFLGFRNHYRQFIHHYAHITRSLNILTSGDNAVKNRQSVEWNSDCDEAFKQLKDLCSKTPILAHSDYSKSFKLHTGAHGCGLGAVSYQTEEDGTDHVIAYTSRTLSKSGRKYPADKLKFPALKWASTDRFLEYLYGGTFEVHTDNNPLTYILT